MLRLNGLMALLNKYLVPLRRIPRLRIGSLTNLGRGLIERRYEPQGNELNKNQDEEHRFENALCRH